MIRLSQKDLARLGGAARSKASPPAAAKSPSASRRKRAAPVGGVPATDDAPRVPAKGGRMARVAYGGVEVVVELDLEPRPKERARTFIDEKALVRAYVSSGGDARRFVAKVKGRAGDGEDGGGGVMRTVTPEDTRRYEQAVTVLAARAMAAAGVERFACPVELDVDFRFAGDAGTWPTAQDDGDLDNLEKAVLDGMNKVVYLDDRLVVRKSGVKRCAGAPGITVRARPASP